MKINTTIILAHSLFSVKSCPIADFTWDKRSRHLARLLVDDGITTCTLYSVEAFMYSNLAHMDCIDGHYGLLEWIGQEKWNLYYTKTEPESTL